MAPGRNSQMSQANLVSFEIYQAWIYACWQGVSVSRSHRSFHLRTGGGGGGAGRNMCRFTYRRVTINQLLILQSLH